MAYDDFVNISIELQMVRWAVGSSNARIAREKASREADADKMMKVQSDLQDALRALQGLDELLSRNFIAQTLFVESLQHDPSVQPYRRYRAAD